MTLLITRFPSIITLLSCWAYLVMCSPVRIVLPQQRVCWGAALVASGADSAPLATDCFLRMTFGLSVTAGRSRPVTVA
jgi:hypothetical protein